MYNILLVIHVMATIALIGIILAQRSSSDSTGLSGNSSTSFLSGRSAASFITRATSLLATVFILTSLGLGIITMQGHRGSNSIMDKLPAQAPGSLVPAAADAKPDAQPAQPAAPAPAATAPAAPAPTVPRPE